MKFRFCGELDCPDWVLAEIATLSRITSIKMKLLCNHVVNNILHSTFEFDKISKLTTDAKYELGDIKGSIASLNYIFTSAAKHGVEEESLSNELQQLGLPKESASALCKVFSEKFVALQEKLKLESMKVSEVKNIDWKVDYVLWSNMFAEVNDSSVALSLQVKEYTNPHQNVLCLLLSSSKLAVLLHDLKQAYILMDEISSSG